jgi:hypothetical protein
MSIVMIWKEFFHTPFRAVKGHFLGVCRRFLRTLRLTFHSVGVSRCNAAAVRNDTIRIRELCANLRILVSDR